LTFDGVGLNNVLDVWCGGYHTIAKIIKGKEFRYHTWGKNDQGQLGIGNFKSQAYPV
jgi:alpha-tubulin suppressor-like RCC1 family protein